ncbi:MAG TPA: hypothetical protein VK994_05135 [Bacteroidales bacterium]|nr:hypothetical protein [Bacteroidales bacterium]
MNLRVALYDTLVNDQLLVRVFDLDNEGGNGKIKIFVSGDFPVMEIPIHKLSLSPIDVFIEGTPVTGDIREVTAKIFSGDETQLHDTDIRMIRLGK